MVIFCYNNMPKRKCSFTEDLQTKFAFLGKSKLNSEINCMQYNVTFSVSHAGTPTQFKGRWGETNFEGPSGHFQECYFEPHIVNGGAKITPLATIFAAIS